MKNLNKIILLLSIFFMANTLSAQPFSNVSVNNVSAINTATLDFSPTFHKDGIVFLSNNLIQGKDKMFDDNIQQKTMSLFIARYDTKKTLRTPEPFAIELVSQVHEGPLTFEKNYKTVYMSRNNHKESNGKAKYADDDVDYMKVFVSQLGDKGWSTPKEMALNAPASDACHPTLSSDGKRLYFSSNRPGGYGGMDLYFCEKVKDEWSEPRNMGNKINSKNNDVFPFVHEDGTLYFSSNRLGGEGDLDIYYCTVDKSSKVGQGFDPPLSMGAPFNSDKDDFGFILNDEQKIGYFSSTRDGGKGLDDIYSFVLPDKMRQLTLVVLDRKTRTPLSKSEICTTNTGTQVPTAQSATSTCDKIVTDAHGKAILPLNFKDNYFLTINQTGYNAEQTTILNTDKNTEIIILMDKKAGLPRPFTLIVLDSKTKMPIKNAEIYLANPEQNTGTTCEKQQTDDKGKAVLSVLNTHTYSIKINKTNYKPVQAGIIKNDTRNEITVFMDSNAEVAAVQPTQPVKTEPTKPTPVVKNSKLIELPDSDYDQVYYLRHIYYDYDKATLRADGQFIVDSLIEILSHFPEMEIEMAAHTDSRGNAKYNQALSERRVASVVQSLQNKSISPSRFRPVAYGKGKMIECPPGVKCTEEMLHQLNRCTEIKLIKKGRLGRGVVIPASHK